MLLEVLPDAKNAVVKANAIRMAGSSWS